MTGIESGFKLIALMDGTSINAVLRNDSDTPLMQIWNKENDTAVPDFSKLGDSAPTLVPIIRDSTNNALLTNISSPDDLHNTAVWKYNGTDLKFGPDGHCINEGELNGVFLKIDSKPTNVDGKTVNLPALRIVKNLASLKNLDNDRITLSGSVEINTQKIKFEGIGADIRIQQSSGQKYDLLIKGNNDFSINKEKDTVALEAVLYSNMNPVKDIQSITYQWYKVLSNGTEQKWASNGTSKTLDIKAADVDYCLTLKCVASYGGSSYNAYTQVFDHSDPYKIVFDKKNVDGDYIRRNTTATITPRALTRTTNEEKVIGEWTFATYDNEYKPKTIHGQSSSTFKGKSISITYDDVVSSKGCLQVIVSANL